MVAELRFPVMGTRAHVIVVGGDHDALVIRAAESLLQRERRWSRFLVTSEITKLNTAKGKPVIVSADTFSVIEAAIEAWRQTKGLFDPTVHAALCALGYNQSFGPLLSERGGGSAAERPAPKPAPGCGAIVTHEALRAVELPEHVTIDLGGIAKGAAADLVAQEVLAAGAAGVCVNVGGDLRVEGTAPTAAGWIIELDHGDSGPPRRVALRAGAVCTSTQAKRQWRRGDETVHHVVDPRTGRSTHGVHAVSVIAARATQAEVLTKAIFVGGIDAAAELFTRSGTCGIVVTEDGTAHEFGTMQEFAA